MAVKITYTSTRPTKEIAFYADAFWGLPEIVSYIKNTYIVTGKLLSTDYSFSEDKLINIWVEYWDSQESCDQYLSDPMFTAAMVVRTEYRKINNIQFIMDNQTVDINQIPVNSYYEYIAE